MFVFQFRCYSFLPISPNDDSVASFKFYGFWDFSSFHSRCRLLRRFVLLEYHRKWAKYINAIQIRCLRRCECIFQACCCLHSDASRDTKRSTLNELLCTDWLLFIWSRWQCTKLRRCRVEIITQINATIKINMPNEEKKNNRETAWQKWRSREWRWQTVKKDIHHLTTIQIFDISFFFSSAFCGTAYALAHAKLLSGLHVETMSVLLDAWVNGKDFAFTAKMESRRLYNCDRFTLPMCTHSSLPVNQQKMKNVNTNISRTSASQRNWIKCWEIEGRKSFFWFRNVCPLLRQTIRILIFFLLYLRHRLWHNHRFFIKIHRPIAHRLTT